MTAGTGSCTGGSIRGPSAFCGLSGIKPTYGLCSKRGVLPLSKTLDHTGPMCRSVKDCAIFLDVMKGYDGKRKGNFERWVVSLADPLLPLFEQRWTRAPCRRRTRTR